MTAPGAQDPHRQGGVADPGSIEGDDTRTPWPAPAVTGTASSVDGPAGHDCGDATGETPPDRRDGRAGAGPAAATRRRVSTGIRFDPAVHARLVAAAADHGLPVNWLVNQAVTEFLDRILAPEYVQWTRHGGER